jgi:hypothetical protein
MSVKIGSKLDLQNLELIKLKIENLDIAPSNPTKGMVYFDTVDNKVKVYKWYGF